MREPHSEASKELIRQRVHQAHERARDRGGYMTLEGKARAKAKRAAHFTDERREQYSIATRQSRKMATLVHKRAADRFARRFLPKIIALQRSGLGLRGIAEAMNEQGFTSRCGRAWTDQTVRQVLKRRPVPQVRKLADEVFGHEQPRCQPPPMHQEPRIIGWNAIAGCR